MNEQEINIAIAKSVGWDFDPIEAREWCSKGKWVKPPGGGIGRYHSIPHYTTDLNAMRRVVLDGMNNGGGAWAKYLEHLRTVCKIPHSHVCLALVEASAAQRAEAYLKTIGKWESTTTTLTEEDTYYKDNANCPVSGEAD